MNSQVSITQFLQLSAIFLIYFWPLYHIKIAFSKIIIPNDQTVFYSKSGPETKLKHRKKRGKKEKQTNWIQRDISFILSLPHKASCNIKCLINSPLKQWLKGILDYWSLLFFYHTSVVIVTLQCILQWNLWTKDRISFNLGRLGSGDIYLWGSINSCSISSIRGKKFSKSWSSLVYTTSR